MGLFTTQGYSGKLVAGSNQTILDTFKDEEIKVSTNILDLFDLGEIPGTFTQTITLPGTKKNNEFFEHYYDISVYTPDLFNTNQIVPAYLDFDSFYLVNGYIQLQKVNVIENKFIDSYEVNLFGIISNFSVDTRSSFLTDLTSLNIYNHTSSVANITSSWTRNLFSGDIVYPMAEYGQQIAYSPAVGSFGIDNFGASLSVQDYKPAIRLKLVWDAIFNQFGYTYTGSFWNEPFLNDVYLILNNQLRTAVYPESIETYGQGKIINISGSSPQILNTGVTQSFTFRAIEYDYNNKFTLNTAGGIDGTLYGNDITTFLSCRGEIGFEVSKSNATPGSGAPQFTVYFTNLDTNTTVSSPLIDINDYLFTVASSRTTTVTEKFKLPFRFRTNEVDSGSLSIRIGYDHTGVDNFVVNLNPDDKNLTNFAVSRVDQIADGQVLEIAPNMPDGNSGIRVIDFIRALQKKFNLIIYADKQNPNQFIVETFNEWYKNGRIVDFNQFINVAEKISLTPANSLAYRQIKFQDAQDTDYITTLFVRANNRSFGESNFYDSASFFSQGQLNVNSEAIASAPLSPVPGTANTGSLTQNCTSYQLNNSAGTTELLVTYTQCGGTSTSFSVPASRIRTICAVSNTLVVSIPSDNYSIVNLGNCSGTPANTGSIQLPVWIPSFISNANYTPAKVLPRIFFYNGLLPATPYWISGYDLPTSSSISTYQLFKYPYFDSYSTGSGSIFPTSTAKSLLFNNEAAVIGSTPTASLISEYWDTYLALLYNPRTRLVECSAVIPFGEYVELELNDIVEFRGSYYHLRAINNYNLKTGQCDLQLLGPIIGDTISELLSGSWAPYNDPCSFTFSASLDIVPSTYGITLLTQGGNSGPNYIVTYTTASTYGPVAGGSPAYIPGTGSAYTWNVTINETSPAYLSFKLTSTAPGLCSNTVEYTFTGSAPIPTGSCCAPTITNTTITGSLVEVSFMTGSSLCLSCSSITVQTSSNGTTWGTATSSLNCSSSYLYTTSSACTGSNVYFRLYQNCDGGTTSSFSNTSSIYISGSGESCCTPTISSLVPSGSVTSSLLLTFTAGTGTCCLDCNYITIQSSSDSGATFGGDFNVSCSASPAVVVGPPLTETYYYRIKQTCTGSVTSSFSPTGSYFNYCTASVQVDNNTTTGGLGITDVTVNGTSVSYVSGDNFTVDSGELGMFETQITGLVTVVISYSAHTGTKHINLTDCASPANSFCDGALNTSGGSVTFEGVEINCGCQINIDSNDGGCI